MVPADWVHPKKYGEERLQPMLDRSFDKAIREWFAGYEAWQKGTRPEGSEEFENYWEWECTPPDPTYYMPDWPEEQKTHLMMYETTSEGTPISPAFATPEELARWLADNGASSFGRNTATYEQWLKVCKGGWAPSAIMSNGKIMSGVEALSEINPLQSPQ
jgi:hypothetical protein